MLTRRLALTGGAVLLAVPARAGGSWEQFLQGVRVEARRKGISQATLDRALTGIQPIHKLLDFDRHQPEFELTWASYRSKLFSAARVQEGRRHYLPNRTLLGEVERRYGVPAATLVGIWGLESNYGASTGGYRVIECLATLSFEGRRTAFFRSELLDALRIANSGDVTPAQMTGSWAGAMGQTQFMPDSFLKYAVPWRGGRRDIWDDLGSVFASTANYLAREGWQPGVPWGERVQAPAGLSPYDLGRDHRRAAGEWARVGVRRADGSPLRVPPGTPTALLLPGGAADQSETYVAYYPSFQAIRRYNPSDFYCICVGLIGDAVVAG